MQKETKLILNSNLGYAFIKYITLSWRLLAIKDIYDDNLFMARCFV